MAYGALILDRYEPLGVAGTGGFGTVQIAWDPRIQRKVAIKTIRLTELDAFRANLPGAQAAALSPSDNRPDASLDSTGPSPTADRWHGVLPWEDFLENEARLHEEATGEPASSLFPTGSADPVTSLAHLPGLDEARTAAMLDDPRIVTVYDFEIRDRTAYLIMEYVEGITLTRLLFDYADEITLPMVTAVFDAVAGALMTAHRAGVLHLDIKPDNIIITPNGQAKVTDFGLATLADASGAGTTGGGTIGYMPLEQMRREHLDVRTDEWSLAALTYEMLTGENPFRAPDLPEAEAAIENAELVLPSLCWDNIDDQIDDVVFYALDPDPAERYASISDFAEEMDKFLGDAELGREHLSWAVSDALGLFEEEPEAADEEGEPEAARNRAKRSGGFLGSLFSSLFAPSPPVADDEDFFEDEEAEDGYEETPPRRRSRNVEKRAHVPLSERVSARTAGLAARLFAIAASAALAFLAVCNMPFLGADGTVRLIVAAVLAIGCAVGAAIRPHIGALSAYCLVGVALVAYGHPVIAALFVIATAAWWYLIGHNGTAEANTALLAPIAGAVGGAAAVPLVAGAALRTVPAIATTAFSAFVAAVFASFGSQSLFGWDAPAHWSFAGADIAGNLIALISQPSTWIAIASWIAAALVLSFLRMRGGKFTTLAGLAIAAAILVAVPAPFIGIDPAYVVSVAIAIVALGAIFA